MPSYQSTHIGGIGVSTADSQSLQVNTVSGALLVDSKPAISVKGIKALVSPATTGKYVSGVGGLALTIAAGVLRILVWASASGVYMDYNQLATSASMPVPTTPFAIEINATDLALISLLGDGSKTVSIIQQY